MAEGISIKGLNAIELSDEDIRNLDAKIPYWPQRFYQSKTQGEWFEIREEIPGIKHMVYVLNEKNEPKFYKSKEEHRLRKGRTMAQRSPVSRQKRKDEEEEMERDGAEEDMDLGGVEPEQEIPKPDRTTTQHKKRAIEECNELRKTHKKLQEEMDELRKELDFEQKTYRPYVTRWHECERRNERFIEEKRELFRRIQAILQEDDISDERLITKLTCLMQKVRTLMQREQEMQLELSSLREKILHQEQQITGLTENLDVQHKKLEMCEQLREELRVQFQLAQNQNDMLQTRLRQLEVENPHLMEERNSFQVDLEKLKKNYKKILEQNTLLEQRQIEESRKYKILFEEKLNIEKVLGEQEKMHRELNTLLKTCYAEKTEKDRQIEYLQNELEQNANALRAEQEKLQKQCTENEKILEGRYSSEILRLQGENQRLLSNIAQLQSTFSQMTYSEDEKQQLLVYNVQLQQQLQQMQAINESLHLQIGELQKYQSQLQTQYESDCLRKVKMLETEEKVKVEKLKKSYFDDCEQRFHSSNKSWQSLMDNLNSEWNEKMSRANVDCDEKVKRIEKDKNLCDEKNVQMKTLLELKDAELQTLLKSKDKELQNRVEELYNLYVAELETLKRNHEASNKTYEATIRELREQLSLEQGGDVDCGPVEARLHDLEDELERTKEQWKRVSDENEILRRQRPSVNDCKAYENQINELENTISMLQSNHSQEMIKMKSECSQNLTQTQLHLDLVQEENEKVNKENKGLKQQLIDLQHRERLETDVEKLTEDKSNLQKEVRQLQSKVENLRNELQMRESEYEQMENEITSTLEDFAKKQEQIKKVMMSNETLTQQIEKYKSSLLALETEIQELRSQPEIDCLKDQKVLARLQELLNENSEKAKEIKSCMEKTNTLQDTILELQLENNTLREDSKASHQEERQAYKQRISNLEEHLENTKEQLREEQEKSSTFLEMCKKDPNYILDCSEYEKEIKGLELALQRKESELESITKQIQILAEQLKIVEEKTSVLVDQNGQLLKENSRLQLDLKQTQNELENFREGKDEEQELRSKNSQLQKQINRLQADKEKLNSELDSFKIDNELLVAENKKLLSKKKVVSNFR